jgi:Male sterility protein
MRVAITGATGFVGGALVSHLAEKAGCEVAALTRGAWHHPSRRVRSVAVGDLSVAAWPRWRVRRRRRGRAHRGDHKLLGSLPRDIKPTCARLDWSPPLSAHDALARRLAAGATAEAQARTRSPRPAPATACQISDRSVVKDMALT